MDGIEKLGERILLERFVEFVNGELRSMVIFFNRIEDSSTFGCREMILSLEMYFKWEVMGSS